MGILIHHRILIILLIVVMLSSMALFLKGFFPVKSGIQGHATMEDFNIHVMERHNLSDSNQTPYFNKLVFVLIDALRADFVLPSKEKTYTKMIKVKELIENGESISFLSFAHPPTVTMPRIKAITSGGIPGFVDVVLNFDSKAMGEDNLIKQLHLNNRSVVFYGDDTWMKLFQGYFIREEGTTSFFVSDYTEVDNNVTRHIDSELNRKDWDVLILHYLGLDHIGHLAGPTSPLVQPKLDEMDNIVSEIYHKLQERDGVSGDRSLLVLCGDHGMSDQGSHGGSSATEVTTPFVLLSSQFSNGGGQPYTGKSIYQIDVAPTLAILFGVPIPQNSLGVLIPDVLKLLKPRERLQAAYVNSQQVLKVFMKNVDDYANEQCYLDIKRSEEAHKDWLQRKVDDDTMADKVLSLYVKGITCMRDKLASSLTNYDLHCMLVAISMMWMALLCTIYTLSIQPNTVDFPITMQTSLVQIISIPAFTCLQVGVCTSSYGSELLCSSGVWSYIISYFIIGFITMFLCGAVGLWSGLDLRHFGQKFADTNIMSIGVFMFVFGHGISLLSSSFVEEEHQTWYFYNTTLYLALCVYFTYRYIRGGSSVEHSHVESSRDDNTHVDTLYKTAESSKNDESVQNIATDTGTVYSNYSANRNDSDCKNLIKQRKPTQGDEAYTQISTSGTLQSSIHDDQPKALYVPRTSYQKCILYCGICLVVQRVARSWNRTGDKWAHLPDVGDWLVRPENKDLLSSLVAVALCTTCALLYRQQTKKTRPLFWLSAFFIYCFRAANGSLSFHTLYGHTPVTTGATEAKIVYSITGMMLWLATSTYRKSTDKNRFLNLLKDIQNMWTLLYMLLMRPHNIVLVTLATLHMVALRPCLKIFRDKLSTPVMTIVFIGLGQAFYFFQGNSNSLTSVDVAAGYIGLASYSPIFIGILMCLNTYAAVIYWMLELLITIASRKADIPQPNSKSQPPYEACFTILLSRCLPVSIYLILVTLQRYHLFVWTVFSPKLLYEGMHMLVMSVFMIIILCINSMFFKHRTAQLEHKS